MYGVCVCVGTYTVYVAVWYSTWVSSYPSLGPGFPENKHTTCDNPH